MFCGRWIWYDAFQHFGCSSFEGGRRPRYGSDDTIELILHTVISVNRLGVHEAAADLCRELARNSRGTVKPAANENLE